MSRALAIAGLSLRQAVRSRALAVLVILLFLCVTALPLTIRGDGTLSGQAQILLSYTLGFATLILTIAGVWAGCAAVSGEVRGRQIQLLVVKPIRPLEIWMGKWIGLMALNGLLLFLAGALVYGMLLWTTRPEALDADQRRRLREEILVARAVARPDESGLEEEARAALESERAAGRLPAEADPQSAYQTLLRLRRLHFYSVPPGGVGEWRIRLPAPPAPDRPIFLHFRFSKSAMDLEAIAGQWYFGSATEARLGTVGAWPPESPQTLPVPPAPFLGEREMRIAFANTDPSGATIFFSPDGGLEVLMRRGGFAANYARAGLLLFIQLAFLSAVGLAAGSLFSMPVAAFVSLSFVIVARAAPYIGAMAEQRRYFSDAPGAGLAATALDAALRVVFRMLRAALAPLRLPDALDLLAGGRWIPWSAVLSAAASHLALYGGLLALLCAAALRRRELGLPE